MKRRRKLYSRWLKFDEMKKIIDDEGIVCPVSKTANWTDIRQFNLMFKTFQGVTEDSTNELFYDLKQLKVFL